MTKNQSITVLISGMVAAVLFGIGTATVLSFPSLAVHAAWLLPIIIVVSFLLTPLIGWLIAPRLRINSGSERPPSRM